MTDYLEEHLGNAEALLERIRQLEQSVSGLSGKNVLRENADKSDDFVENRQNKEEKSGIVSDIENEVYNMDTEVNQIKKLVDNLGVDLEIREKERDIVVNRQKRADDNGQNLGQAETASRVEETGARTNAERAEKRPPLSAQLEELDRAVSAMTALLPAERGTSGYPISLSAPKGPVVDPNITGVPGEVWSGTDTPASADFAYGGTPSWAEQADRMFRRDSRRYDGGFYLY